MQKENQELLNYVTKIKKSANIQCQYKGKPIDCTQNKSRTLKTFMSRAETALCFSEGFGLDIATILVKECQTGKKHTVNFEPATNDQVTSTAHPQISEKNNRYNNLTEGYKKQVEQNLVYT